MRVSLALHAVVALLAVMLVGCTVNQDYLYAPRAANTVENGLPSAQTLIPPDAPRGSVQVTSYGVADISPDGDADVPMLIVRMIVENSSSETPWTIDTREERVRIADEGESRALYVNTDVQTLPSVSVAAGERRVLDFYFPLPDGLESADDVPGFDFLWQIDTPSGAIPGRTAFDRELAEPPAAVAGPRTTLVIGWGPYWWYDPLYPRVVFVHPRRIIVAPYHRRGHVIIRRAPRGHYRDVAPPPGPRGGVRHMPARGGRPHR